jgi:hypothetical protein
MFTIETETKNLNEAMSLFAKETKKGIEDVIEQQTGMIVGHLIAMTPPGASKGQAMGKTGAITNVAKKRGEGRIKADIATLFPTTATREPKAWGMIENGHLWKTSMGPRKVLEYASSLHDLRRVHQFARSRKTGRVRTGLNAQNMALTTKALRNAYAKQKIKNVGMLNAGWLRAAEKVKTAKRSLPVWITRHHKKPGDAIYKRSRHGLAITVSNRMPYFPRDIDARMQRAVERRERGIAKKLKEMAERKAKRANQRMKR